MSRVTAYEASDGSLHRDRKSYKTHEQNLQAASKILGLIGGAVPASNGTAEGDAERESAIQAHYDMIVNKLGLSTLRDTLNVPFRGVDSDDNENGNGNGEGAAAGNGAGTGPGADGQAAGADQAPAAGQAPVAGTAAEI